MNDPVPFPIAPMLATLVGEPFHRKGWIFEEKYDGYRILAWKRGPKVELRSRNGNDKTAAFAEIAEAVAALPARTAVLDGEVVGFDEHLVSRFQLIGGGQAPRVRGLRLPLSRTAATCARGRSRSGGRSSSR